MPDEIEIDDDDMFARFTERADQAAADMRERAARLVDNYFRDDTGIAAAPLAVIWLCALCHAAHHSALPTKEG